MLQFITVSTTARHLHASDEQYAALEEESQVRHEYLDGEIYAVAGGSTDHAALAATVIRLLRSRLPLGRTLTSDDLPAFFGPVVTGERRQRA